MRNVRLKRLICCLGLAALQAAPLAPAAGRDLALTYRSRVEVP